MDYIPRRTCLPWDIQPKIAGMVDEDLPEPWTCDWRAWGPFACWENDKFRLQRRFNLYLEKPLRFRSTHTANSATVFLGTDLKSGSTHFYFYDAPSGDLFCFQRKLGRAQADSIGPAEFVEAADWNKMKHMGSLADPDAVLRDRNIYGAPLLLQDLHKFETPWGFERRELRDAVSAHRHLVDTAVQKWCSIPDDELPEPWSCNWDGFEWWYLRSVNAELRNRYGLESLTPVMFDCPYHPTIVLEAGGVFYLYDTLTLMNEIPRLYQDILGASQSWHTGILHQFAGVFSSVEDFIENADWKKMKLVLPQKPDGEPTSLIFHQEAVFSTLPITSHGGEIRIAKHKSQKRTMWDLYRPPVSAWGYEPRFDRISRSFLSSRVSAKALRNWGNIPDKDLPEPWTSNWLDWDTAERWDGPPDYDFSYYKVDLERRFGIPALEPMMFKQSSSFYMRTILSSGGRYYLQEDDRVGSLWEFGGTYVSIEDFLQNGDWNMLKERDEIFSSDKEED
ncbi:hypothetical protein B0H19DRAFT_1262723 [Mycena capillaripes]|nr:hypothetical protein B0H19DRAFT_1262723 [Mycena capillaripes]